MLSLFLSLFVFMFAIIGMQSANTGILFRQSSIVVPQLSKWADTPSQLLIDLWREPRPLDVFVSTCHLCQFLRVSLKSVCVKCGSLFKPEGCLAPACGNVAQSHMLAKFRYEHYASFCFLFCVCCAFVVFIV